MHTYTSTTCRSDTISHLSSCFVAEAEVLRRDIISLNPCSPMSKARRHEHTLCEIDLELSWCVSDSWIHVSRYSAGSRQYFSKKKKKKKLLNPWAKAANHMIWFMIVDFFSHLNMHTVCMSNGVFVHSTFKMTPRLSKYWKKTYISKVPAQAEEFKSRTCNNEKLILQNRQVIHRVLESHFRIPSRWYT